MTLSSFTSNFFKYFFGENGDNQYPSQETDPTNLVSWSQGYTPLYSEDPLQNGKYIDRQKFNGILGTLSQEIKYQQLFQSRFWDNKIVSLGGYPKGASCYVWMDMSTKRLNQSAQNSNLAVPVRVISMKDNNTTSPYSSGAVNDDWWIDDGVAIGGIYISDVNLSTPPDGYLDIGSTNSQQIFYKSDYPRIKAILNSNSGSWGYFKNYSSDPTNRFELINRRGYFHRVWNNGSSIDSGRQFQTLQNDAIRNIKNRNSIEHFTVAPSTVDFSIDYSPFTVTSSGWASQDTGLSTGRVSGIDVSKVVPTASENRPYNANEKRYIKV